MTDAPKPPRKLARNRAAVKARKRRQTQKKWHSVLHDLAVERNLPLPPRSIYDGFRSTLNDMAVGDSTFAPGGVYRDPMTGWVRTNRIHNWIKRARARHPERRYATRVVIEDGLEGVRVWRLPDDAP